jgi:hypothetical protein
MTAYAPDKDYTYFRGMYFIPSTSELKGKQQVNLYQLHSIPSQNTVIFSQSLP